jgi:predicted MFS family arabinose efflux permease
MVTNGFGLFLGSLLAGRIMEQSAREDARVFWIPCLINASLLVVWVAGFHPRAASGPDIVTEDDRPAAVPLGVPAPEPAEG